MSGDDELERLLREVDASLAGTSGGSVTPAKGSSPATRAGADPAPSGSRPGRAVRTGAVAGVVCGASVFVGTTLLSWLPGDQAAFQSGVGAFVGAFLTGAVLSLRRSP